MVQKSRRWGTVFLALILASVLLLMVAPASQGQSSDDSEAEPPSGNSEQGGTPNSSRLLQKAEREGRVCSGNSAPSHRLRTRREVR
jgi:hypothetical protein